MGREKWFSQSLTLTGHTCLCTAISLKELIVLHPSDRGCFHKRSSGSFVDVFLFVFFISSSLGDFSKCCKLKKKNDALRTLMYIKVLNKFLT